MHVNALVPGQSHKFALSIYLERGTYSEPEGLSGLLQDIIRAIKRLGLLKGVVSSPTGRKHLPFDQRLSRDECVQDERIIGIVQPERSIDNRQNHLELYASGHSWGVIRPIDWLQSWAK